MKNKSVKDYLDMHLDKQQIAEIEYTASIELRALYSANKHRFIGMNQEETKSVMSIMNELRNGRHS